MPILTTDVALWPASLRMSSRSEWSAAIVIDVVFGKSHSKVLFS